MAFIANTTQGIGLIAEGYPWQPGDSVVTAAEEYPSNLFPWMNLASRGVSVRTVPTRADGRIWVEDLAAAIDSTTRVLTISHVEFATGFRNDLDRLARGLPARGVALFVDAIQGLGPLTIDVRATPIDFLAADGHKWLLGPEGAGLLYIKRDWIERLRPIGVGWKSVVSDYNSAGIDFTLKPNAARWEGGTFAMAPLQAFAQSIGLFLEIGPAPISERILDRAEAVREVARSAGWTVYGSTRPEDWSGIVAIEQPGSTRRLRPGLREQRSRAGLPAGSAPDQPPHLQQRRRPGTARRSAPGGRLYWDAPPRVPRQDGAVMRPPSGPPCSPARSTR